MSAHTPTPWAVCGSDEHWIDIKPAREKRRISLSIATVATCTVDAEANAAFIVRACNAHDDLVAALKAMVSDAVELAESGDAGFWDAEKVPAVIAARAALARAEASS
ncbi:hypothetical protein [Methylopila sp. 73B]|uniref:hypothetical protein n=1 Tax=Methylopila sp. 73B TaxID=1120792 RepID=UPI0005601678|nr:hypothetical protein [Methylopila sp. 73B]